MPTLGVQEGFAALLEYDPSSSGEDNARLMEEAAHRVVAGEVTRAVRRRRPRAGEVAVGDFIGLSQVRASSPSARSLADATIGLLDRARSGRVTRSSPSSQGRGVDRRRDAAVPDGPRGAPEVTVELHHGGQPLYPYLVSIE